jgi:hypothetical protein
MAGQPGNDASFRVSGRGREPLATPSSPGFHVYVPSYQRAGVGAITSIRSGGESAPVRMRMSDLEYLSIVSGIPVRDLLRRN